MTAGVARGFPPGCRTGMPRKTGGRGHEPSDRESGDSAALTGMDRGSRKRVGAPRVLAVLPRFLPENGGGVSPGGKPRARAFERGPTRPFGLVGTGEKGRKEPRGREIEGPCEEGKEETRVLSLGNGDKMAPTSRKAAKSASNAEMTPSGCGFPPRRRILATSRKQCFWRCFQSGREIFVNKKRPLIFINIWKHEMGSTTYCVNLRQQMRMFPDFQR